MRALTIFSRIFFVIYLYTAFTYSGKFMILSFILAYIPFELALLIKKSKSDIIAIILSFFWILFYPNAPYILTDFFHLEVLGIYSNTSTFNSNNFLWLGFVIMTSGILVDTLLGFYSLIIVVKRLTKKIVHKYVKIFITILLLFTITLAAGFAIYLGRFPRLHSHYFINNPAKVLKIIVESISMKSFEYSILMAILQLLLISPLIIIGSRDSELNLFHNNKSE